MLSKIILLMVFITLTTGYIIRRSSNSQTRNIDSTTSQRSDENTGSGRSFKGAVEAVQAAARLSNKGKAAPESKFSKFKLQADEIDKTEFISGAAEGTIGGLMTVIGGIQSGSWVDIATGSLDMITSIVGMMGPTGAIIGAVLSLISSLIGLFGGSTGDEESQEQMMERIVKAALDEARSEELKAEVNGAKEFFSTLSDTINIFREKDTMTYEQALSFYQLSFEGVRIFGILEHYINSWCAVGQVDSKNMKVKDPTSKRCLSALTLYCDLSIFRQILLADMAGVVAKAGLDSTAIVFLELIEKEKKKDMTILNFLEEPFENRDHRYVIAQYYSKKNDYPTIAMYLKDIMKSRSTFGSPNWKPRAAMECQLWELQGSCRQIILEKLHQRYPICVRLMWRIQSSIFIPDGFRLERRFSRTVIDRFYGPSVYGASISKETPETNLCFDTLNKHANDRVRICEGERMSLTGKCASLALKSYDQPELSTMEWENRIKSVYVPKGIVFTGYVDRNFGGESNTFYGPATYMLVTKPNAYSSLKIEKTQKKTSDMVQLCTETNLNGNCMFYEFTLATKYTTKDLKRLNSAFTFTKSMKVPSNLTVNMFTWFNDRDVFYGKYVGPVTIAETEFPLSGIQVDKSV